MKKRTKCLLCAILALILLALLIPAGCILSTVNGQGEPEADWLIVLGTTVNGTEPSPMLRQRLDAALDYLHTYPDARCIVTGGKGDGENLSEAQCMYNYLTAAGIAPDQIRMEDRANNTIENLKNTLTLIAEEPGGVPAHAAILSSDFHLYRAGRMAKSLGMDVSLVPAKTEPLSLLAPWFVREIFAIWSFLLTGK